MISKLTIKAIINKSLLFGNLTNRFSILNKLTGNKQKKEKEEFKKQIQYLANKPTFTLMDYKQRVTDQLVNLRKSIKNKFSNANVQMEKSLIEEKTILNALFQEELIEEIKVKGGHRSQIAIVTQINIDKINEVFKKVERYKNIHRLLRHMKEQNQPLPQNSETLNYLYMQSGLQLSSKKNKYQRYQKRSKASIIRSIKFKDN